MKNQKFQWIEAAKQLPENPQQVILVSYLFKTDAGEPLRVATDCLCFNPKTNIVDGKLVFGNSVCDYWSPVPNLPKGVVKGMLNDRPALNPILKD